MIIPPISGVGAPPVARPPSSTPAPGFADAMANGIQQVSNAEKSADAAAMDVATGGPTGLHELMAQTSKAQLSVDLLVQVRNRAVEAYQEIMRIQV